MYSTSQRERILAEFEASGLSLHAFSRESGVSRGTLQTWRRQAAEAAAVARRGALFARVHVAAAPSEAPPLEVHVGAVRVVVPNGADPRYLRVVLDALGAFS